MEGGEEEPAEAEAETALEEAAAEAEASLDVEEIPAPPARADVANESAAKLEAAVQAEAKSVEVEALDPERNLRQEQLTKKQADVAKKEEKKKNSVQRRKERRQRKQKKNRRAQKKAEAAQVKEKSEGGLPEAAAVHHKDTKKRRKSKKGKIGAEDRRAVPEAAEEPSPVASGLGGEVHGPAAEHGAASESPRKRPAARQTKDKAKAKPKGRPRGATASAGPEGVEAEEPKGKKAKGGPKGGGAGTSGAVDKALAKSMQDFMRAYTSKKYVKSEEQLHKVPGFNLYAAREAAAFKLQDAEQKTRQIAYFGLRLDACCSQAVNVYLARAYYDKMASENLACEWADSEEGLNYRALLINTANFAYKGLS